MRPHYLPFEDSVLHIDHIFCFSIHNILYRYVCGRIYAFIVRTPYDITRILNTVACPIRAQRTGIQANISSVFQDVVALPTGFDMVQHQRPFENQCKLR